jgi:Helix-turn-helix.
MFNDTEIGPILKKIRSSKHLTQVEVCDNFITRTALSKIESGQTTPNYRTLSHILNKLDITFDELEYLSGSFNMKKIILTDFWAITNNSEQVRLKHVINQCNSYLKSHNDPLINDILLLANVLLSLPNISTGKYTINNEIEKIKKIWLRINKMDSWTLNELRLACCCLFYYPIETSTNIARRVEKELLRYENFNPIKSYIVGQYINLTSLYLYVSDFSSAKSTNIKALQLAKEINRYDYYFLCTIRQGILDKNNAKITFGIEFLEKIEKYDMVNSLKKEIEHYSFF